MKTFLKGLIIVALCHLNMWYLCNKYGTITVYGYVANSTFTNEADGANHIVTVTLPDGESKTYRNRSSIALIKGTKRCKAIALVTVQGAAVKLIVNKFGDIIHAEKFEQTIEQDVREVNANVKETVGVVD